MKRKPVGSYRYVDLGGNLSFANSRNENYTQKALVDGGSLMVVEHFRWTNILRVPWGKNIKIIEGKIHCILFLGMSDVPSGVDEIENLL